jgi:signal transduction histidine kinase
MSRLAEFVVESQRPQAEAKEQTIALVQEPLGRALVNADEGRLRDAIDNLVSNAVKFSPRGSTVRVAVQRRFDVVRCQVSDQGPGLTEEDQKQLFQRFHRLTARPTAGESSTGFGLWIVKQIVDLHGGRVWAESTSGSGSSFVLELPAYEEHFPGPRDQRTAPLK